MKIQFILKWYYFFGALIYFFPQNEKNTILILCKNQFVLERKISQASTIEIHIRSKFEI